MTAAAPALTPAQQDVVAQLGAGKHDRPTFRGELRHELRATLEDGIGPLAADLAERDRPLVLNKHRLASVHGCEARFLAEDGPDFTWSVPTARGTVAHKALELSVHVRPAREPLELVDEALARLEEGDDTLADWLQGAGEFTRAELRADAGDRVTKFIECWPPLRAAWKPVTESRLNVELCEGQVALKGKVDLSLGSADGTTAGKVLVDLKTGGFAPSHLDDLRFYALIEAIRLGTPPRRLATYYLDAGKFVSEDVTEGLLQAAVARTIAGVAKLVELRAGRRPPVLRVGPPCRWCSLLESCEPGRAEVAAASAYG